MHGTMKIKDLSNNASFTYRRREYKVASKAVSPASELKKGVRCERADGKVTVFPYDREVKIGSV